MNILKTVLLVFGVSLLVSACAEDTIGNNGSAGSTDANVAPTLERPYIGDNSTYGNGSQDYAYMKDLATKDNYVKKVDGTGKVITEGGTANHPMLKNYFNRGWAAYSSIHNNWFDWTQDDENHGFVENNRQIVPDMNGTNATKSGVRFPHSYHQDIARYTDLIGNCTTNCHIRYDNATEKPFAVAPGNADKGATHSKIVFRNKIQVGDSSYKTNTAHDFCWSCHANLPQPTRAPHGYIVTSDNVTHQPNGSCSQCHYWPLNSIAEPGKGAAVDWVDGQGKADVQFYGRPDVREDYFKNKAALPTAFDPATAHAYPDATETFNYTDAGPNQGPYFDPADVPTTVTP